MEVDFIVKLKSLDLSLTIFNVTRDTKYLLNIILIK